MNKNKLKITVEIPEGKFCGECPCCGLSGKEEEYCGFFHKQLSMKGGKTLKDAYCINMCKILKMEQQSGGAR